VQASLQRTTAKGCGVWSGKLLENRQIGENGPHGVGRRIATLALILLRRWVCSGMGRGRIATATQLSPRIASELNRELSRARQGLAGTRTRSDRAIQTGAEDCGLARVQSNGGRMGAKLDLIKGRPSQSQSMRWRPWKRSGGAVRERGSSGKGMDDYTNDAMKSALLECGIQRNRDWRGRH